MDAGVATPEWLTAIYEAIEVQLLPADWLEWAAEQKDAFLRSLSPEWRGRLEAIGVELPPSDEPIAPPPSGSFYSRIPGETYTEPAPSPNGAPPAGAGNGWKWAAIAVGGALAGGVVVALVARPRRRRRNPCSTFGAGRRGCR
jgi:hypothetical protein